MSNIALYLLSYRFSTILRTQINPDTNKTEWAKPTGFFNELGGFFKSQERPIFSPESTELAKRYNEVVGDTKAEQAALNEIMASSDEKLKAAAKTAQQSGTKIATIGTSSRAAALGMKALSSNGNYYIKDQTLKNAAALVKDVMLRRNVPIERVIRHYDVTGKICPAPLVNEGEWKKFKQMIENVGNETKEDFKMFPDVKENDYAYNHIKKLKDYGIVNGDENGNYNPDNPITRRDMAIITANVLTYLGK